MMDRKWFEEQAQEVEQQVIACRRHLHSCPELSFEEHQTADYIAAQLDAAGVAYRRIAGTGILAQIEGEGDLKNCVVLRADIDALPIDEQTGLEFASTRAGVMHACGHDLHTACLLGVLLVAARHREMVRGTLFGLFQPGEETAPGGAAAVMTEDPFRDYRVQAFVGEHVAPELPAGSFGFRAGQYMASSDEVHLRVRGTGGHGALPHTLTDPVVAAAAMIVALQQVVSRNANATIPTVLSFGRVIADGATNIIPPVVEIAGTLRTMDETWRQKAHDRIRSVAEGVAMAHGVEVEVVIPQGYPCVVNDARLAQRARALAVQMWGEQQVVDLPLRMTAEDFGTYTRHYPALFYRLGTQRIEGDAGGGLHTSTFNPDERALRYGVAMMAALAFDMMA